MENEWFLFVNNQNHYGTTLYVSVRVKMGSKYSR